MSYQSYSFPLFGTQEFAEKDSKDFNLLFNELRGERSVDKPHKHDSFIINLFEKGKGFHTIDLVRYNIEDHQIHLVFPGQPYQWKLEKETVGYQLMISKEWYESFLPTLRFSSSYFFYHPVFKVSEELIQLLVYEFRAIKKELSKENTVWKLAQRRTELIGLLMSKSMEDALKGFEICNSNPIISKFLNFIDEYFKTERSVYFYAGKLNVSANYLNILCKKFLNRSASSLIQDRILLEAKHLLKVSDIPVKNIVYELGFYDHPSFTKFFKTKTGMTPSQFKEEFSQNKS